MSQPLPYATVEIRPDRTKSLRQGHPWVFSGAIAGKTTAQDGDPVLVCCQGAVLGLGLYHGQTDIAIRMIAKQPQLLDTAFFKDRFTQLKQFKEAWLPPKTNAYRLVFGEGDFLPGLIIDRYDQVLVVQAHTLAMGKLLQPIFEALTDVFHPQAIVERSDVRNRKQEGGELASPVRVAQGELPEEVVFVEYGLQFMADVMQGQKTGFFLDQRENRQALQRWVQGRNLLNTFCYSGGFSVACAKSAASITNVDISKRALEVAKRNYALNGLSVKDEQFLAVDVFEYLKSMPKTAHDAILLDPPSFAKNRGQIKTAIKAYTSLNTLALRKLPEGGILATSSCTAHIDHLTFIKIIHQSSVEAGCSLSVLDSREQPHDHPYQLSFPEGRYLKFLVLQKRSAL
jgi:23S rRNA (cytosine1962-C5)-methyltransferase